MINWIRGLLANIFLFVEDVWVFVISVVGVIAFIVFVVYSIYHSETQIKKCDEVCGQYRTYRCELEYVICGTDKEGILKKEIFPAE